MAGILMIAVQALEKRNREIRAENADLKARLEEAVDILMLIRYISMYESNHFDDRG